MCQYCLTHPQLLSPQLLSPHKSNRPRLRFLFYLYLPWQPPAMPFLLHAQPTKITCPESVIYTPSCKNARFVRNDITCCGKIMYPKKGVPYLCNVKSGMTFFLNEILLSCVYSHLSHNIIIFHVLSNYCVNNG